MKNPIVERSVGESDESREEQLVAEALAGSHRAFEEIVGLYQKRVFRLAWGFFHDQEDAMEIVQDTFLKVYKNLASYKHHTSLKNWIYKIATNICIDQYRKFKKKRSEEDSLDESIENRLFGNDDVEEQVTRRSDLDNIKKSLSSLSKRQKMVFVMKHGNGLKFREIAVALGISIGTVKSLHHRAMTNVKESMVALERVK